MKQNVFLSFIVPVYNVAPYLRECLDSILQQECQDFEICIVDDGSSDGGAEICDEYKTNFCNKVKLLHQTNQGVSVARNKAIEMAEGEYIWFVDSDDYVSSSKALSYIKKVIDKSKCDVLFFGPNEFEECIDNIKYTTEDKSNFLQKHICYCNPLMIFKRSIITDADICFTPCVTMGEDLEFQYKYLIHCLKPAAIEFNFYHIREREGSASRESNTDLKNFESNKCILDNLIDYLKTHNVEHWEWLNVLLAGRIRSFLQSATMLPETDKKEIGRIYNQWITQLKQLGFTHIDNGSLKAANIDVRLYVLLYRILMLLNRKR